MSMLWSKRQCENLDKAAFEGVGEFDIPQMRPVLLPISEENGEKPQMIGFNLAARFAHPGDVGVHFFLKDYQFTRLWTSPDIYTPMLERFRFVCTPDFSMFTDYPLAIQIYSHYKKHWLGAYWQAHGMTVVPTISWSDERSYGWCFDGDPVNGTVAVSSVGTQMNAATKTLFLRGFERMIDRLSPRIILFHGDIPPEIPEMIREISAENRPVLAAVAAFQQRLRAIGKA